MSRYGGDPRYAGGSIPYRDGPAPRWDADRFSREREHRYHGPPVMVRERERPLEGYGRRMEERFATPPRDPEPRFEERYFSEERYGPPGRRVDKKYYEEDEIYDSRAPVGGAMVPYRPARPEAPPRPGILRRQSSLDTFDRKPVRRYDDFEERDIIYKERDVYRSPPPRIEVPVAPRPPSPRRYGRPSRFETDEIRVAEPDFYGDNEFRAYKEREWTTMRRRRGSSGSRERARGPEREEVIEEVQEVEKPFPRRGKTRMPRRLVHTKVLFDLGYPYYEEVRQKL